VSSTRRSAGGALKGGRWWVVALLIGAATCCLVPAGATAAADDEPAVTLAAPSMQRGAWVAKIVQPTRAVPAPGSSKRGVPVATTVDDGGYFSQELLVLERRTLPDGEGWLRVRLPVRPNDAEGWIPEDAARLRHTDWWVRVRTERRTIEAYEGGRLRLRARAVVGARATPTPRGLFAVLLVAKQRDPHGFLGPWAVHLTSHSDVLENFGGGPGRVAIHGRDGESLQDPLGSARSHGCVRVSNGSVTLLARWLRPGTPVQITG